MSNAFKPVFNFTSTTALTLKLSSWTQSENNNLSCVNLNKPTPWQICWSRLRRCVLGGATLKIGANANQWPSFRVFMNNEYRRVKLKLSLTVHRAPFMQNSTSEPYYAWKGMFSWKQSGAYWNQRGSTGTPQGVHRKPYICSHFSELLRIICWIVN